MARVAVTPGFWRGKKVLLTGHTGFKGSWLAIWLQQLGAEVTGLALPAPTTPSLFEAAGLAGAMTSIMGDIRDAALVRGVINEHQPEIVLHLAAQSLVRESYADPVGTYATNVLGTAHVLDAARQAKHVRAVLVVTSDKCYRNHEWERGYTETDELGGGDPYSNSKSCAELVTETFRKSFKGPAIASARAGNVIGGGDWATDRLVPDAVRAALAGQPLLLRNPQAVRPWQHVLEPLGGYLLLTERLYEKKDVAEGWNFGPEDADARPVSWVAEAVQQRWPGTPRWQLADGAHPHEAHTLRLDITKARERLGWTPKLGLERALDWTVSWYRAHAEGKDARRITEAQIAEYAA